MFTQMVGSEVSLTLSMCLLGLNNWIYVWKEDEYKNAKEHAGFLADMF